MERKDSSFYGAAIWLLVVLIWCLILVSRAFGEPEYGQDYLALQHQRFDVRSASQVLAPGTPVGVLDKTFGEGADHLKFILDSVRPKFVRVHIFNTTCVRNQNCGRYEIVYGYTKKSLDEAIRRRDRRLLEAFRKRVAIYKALAGGASETRFIISPALEHDLSKEAWRILADNVLAVWPDVQLDNSPDGGIDVERYKGAWIERHGTSPQAGADIVSTDGAEVTDTNIRALKTRTKLSKIVFAWSRGFNCRSNSPTFVDPRARKDCSDRGVLDEVSHIFVERGTPPAYSGGAACQGFKSPSTWKPLAEDTGNGDSRANKPVLIIRGFKNATVLVQDSRGNKVGSLGYYSNYLNVGLRYYSGFRGGDNASGYNYETRARANTGSPYVWLRQGKTCFGPLSTGMRQGTYK